jgi:hypothetical protein
VSGGGKGESGGDMKVKRCRTKERRKEAIDGMDV